MDLGLLLKESRKLSKLTLRQVEEATGISNAYLSQLENGKIKKPSANVLYKIASVYRVDINQLMKSSGLAKNETKSSDDFLDSVSFYARELTEYEMQEVLDFLKFKFSKLSREVAKKV
jgi:transcriptional regulator with XRE-family HTH domain